MSKSRQPGTIIVGSAPEATPDKETDQDTIAAVAKAYIVAVHGPEEMRRHAFEAALRTYRERYPGVREALARHRVAKILCFAGSAEPQRQIG